ncbi:MAG: class I SAM-dependent RNA methyltransferase, partial [Bacteroidota bacterium]
MSDNIRFVAKTITGLEEVLAKELQSLGARNVEQLYRAVAFTGDKGFLYKANFCLHTALRILVPIKSFEVSNEDSLYNAIKSMPWEEYLDATDSLAIDTVLSTRLFNHSQFISQKAKDAIVDRFREKFQVRPNVDLKNPALRINLHINENICNVSFDSSGESLHKRGYREQTNLAPMNEVLAAGLVKLSGWQKHQPLIDPMCGSGTILIEAALIAANIPPGYFREHFGFMNWKKFMPFDEELWKTITEGVISRIDSADIEIIGGALSHNVARKAKENVKLARVEDMVTIRESDMRDFDPPSRKGVVIVNPPYGERMDKDDLTELYKSIGDTFKQKFSGYDCWLITSNKEALKSLGLRTSRR